MGEGAGNMQRTIAVCSFESRRESEMRLLLEKQGLNATVAPSMRELPLDENPAAFAFAESLLAGRVHVVIFMTGVGARGLMEVLETRYERAAILSALDRCVIVVRGPKPVVVLREWGLRIDHRAPEPNTWRELLATLDSAVPLAGHCVAVQEYGVPNELFYEELRNRAAEVISVPIYKWAFPEDTAPLRSAIERTIRGEFDVLLLTSANQLHNIVQCARDMGLEADWLAAAKRCKIASIGPTASETIRAYNLPLDLEPTHPKMGTLAKEVAEACQTWFGDSSDAN